MKSRRTRGTFKGSVRPRFLNAPPPAGSDAWHQPWAQLRTFSYHPIIYPAMIGAVSGEAAAGDLVTVYDKQGRVFGAGLYNPRARVPLRVVTHGAQPADEHYFRKAIDRAVQLREELGIPNAETNACRLINSDGDGLSGLTVDRYAKTLNVEVHSLGIYRRLPEMLAMLHDRLGTVSEVIHIDPQVARMEGIPEKRHSSPSPKPVRIREHVVHYEVDFAHGHKTGFFCDQRENRLKLTRLTDGARLLDVCCYTGGFAVAAARLGHAAEVTEVDLDESVVAQARRNGNINQKNRIKRVHADAFGWMRQAQQNGERWDVVVLDPPKFVMPGDEDERLGWQKYEDLNRLGIALVMPEGWLVTCSCSGGVTMEQFEQILIRAAHRQNLRLQFVDRTGPGPDHPVMSNALEGRYLKVIWVKVW